LHARGLATPHSVMPTLYVWETIATKANNMHDVVWLVCVLACMICSGLSGRLAPIMLLKLPIIPFRISQNFYPLFFIYSHIIPYYSSIFDCINDNNVHNAYNEYYTEE